MNKELTHPEQISADQCIYDVKFYLRQLQDNICSFIEAEEEQKKFRHDDWLFKEQGGGQSRILEDGKFIEKAGVNFSHVVGTALPKAATLRRPDLADSPFHALGVSTVVHPRNPYAPTTHMNVRFIVVERQEGEPFWWFGGGFDLTPYYGFEEDCIHWHRHAKLACEPFGHDVYPHFKTWCDQYFFLPHRQEPRGIGGLFFDDMREWGFAKTFSFVQSVGEHFISAYQPILTKRKEMVYGERERQFQLYRRGRYVEFNLLYDRGTLFGIQSGGRTESILMSLPPLVAWTYNWHPEKESEEAELYEKYLIARDWV